MNGFQTGDLVRVKFASVVNEVPLMPGRLPVPIMVIEEIIEDAADCIWWNGEEFKWDNFVLDTLVRI